MPEPNQRKTISQIDTAQIKQAVSGNNAPESQNYQESYSPSIPNFPESQTSQDAQNYEQRFPQYQNSQQYPPEVPQLTTFPQKPMTQEVDSEMTPSIMSQEDFSSQSQYSDPYQTSNSGYGNYSGFDESSQYSPYSSGISPETITEIAESVALEKISPITRKIEKIIDFKTTFEAKISSIDDRLKKIEKIIESLQLSILERVGKYVNDVSDLKKELIETQKTFSSKHNQHPQHSQNPHPHSNPHQKHHKK